MKELATLSHASTDPNCPVATRRPRCIGARNHRHCASRPSDGAISDSRCLGGGQGLAGAAKLVVGPSHLWPVHSQLARAWRRAAKSEDPSDCYDVDQCAEPAAHFSAAVGSNRRTDCDAGDSCVAMDETG
jgi:hypothetical protein